MPMCYKILILVVVQLRRGLVEKVAETEGRPKEGEGQKDENFMV